MSCQQASFITEDSYLITDSSIATAYFPPPARKFIPMKSTEQFSNDGKYASRQSPQQQLSRTNEQVKRVTDHTALTYVKSVAGHQTINTNSIDSERNKWKPALSGPNTNLATNIVGETVSPAKSKDWFLAAKSYHIKSESAKDTRLAPAMSLATIKFAQQTSLNVEHVTNSHINHSNAKASATAFPSINSPNSQNRQRSEQRLHASQINLQQKLKTSVDINRANKQISSLNGNGEHAIETAESLHKSITNQSTLGNSPASKLNESGKPRKSTLTERKYKQKDAKSTYEKKKNGHGSGSCGKNSVMTGRKSTSNQLHHESLQRLPLRSNENGAIASIPPNADADRCIGKRMEKEWHSPESYIYDDISTDTVGECPEFASCMQTFWFRDIPNENLLTREQRLENKRDNLRRQAFQYAQAQHFRSTIVAKRRLITVTKALAKFKNERNKASPTKCSIQSCSNAALAMTAYCHLHITLNKDQKLFHPCTAKFSDNSQCRVPVFDISHELPLCREHAWKRDNYNRISQEQKPKKNLKCKTKSSECVRQPKRNKKKKKRNQLVLSEAQIIPKPQLKAIGQMSPKQAAKQNIPPTINVVWNQELFRKGENPQIISAKSPALVTSVNKYLPDNVMVYQLSNTVPHASKIKIQNIISVGENSSAYESSEDTGVGELSESELMTAQDGIEIPLGDARLLEEHDLTNVLNQLPVDAFNDLFQVQQHDHYEPTQKEQDELARALEEVDEQVKSLEQMTSSSHFLDNFLDVNDEILVDGSDICDELTTTSVKNDIRGLVHT